MNWEETKFFNFIFENNVIGFFKKPIILKSGRKSYWYVNWRNVSEDTYLIDQLSDYILSFISHLNLKPSCFFGVPEGATKLGIILQFKWAKQQSDYAKNIYPLSMGRGKPKEHGDPKDRYFLGKPRGDVIILEDVTTTGNSLIKTIDDLLKLDLKIISAIGLTNRNELRDDGKSVEEVMSDRKIPYFAMSNAVELLPKIYKSLQPGENIGAQIEEYFKNFGEKEIKLI